VEALLVDIAGLDDPRTALDRQAQQAARQAIESADVVLLISDGRNSPGFSWSSAATTDPNPGQSRGCLNPPQSRAVQLRVRTKSDLADGGARLLDADLAVSALTGEGLDQLRQRLAAALGSQPDTFAGQMLALQPRHEAALREALAQLITARQRLAQRRRHDVIDQVELVASALRLALDQLAGLGGALTPDDVIGRVFSTFCIGK
jgi:tRNA modification GTPase